MKEYNKIFKSIKIKECIIISLLSFSQGDSVKDITECICVYADEYVKCKIGNMKG